MAVHETKKQSDLEKRLRILRQSLNVGSEAQGKQRSSSNTSSDSDSYRLSGELSKTTISSASIGSDITYLKKDLLKITVLSIIAFGVQAALHLSLTNHLLKLPF